MLTFQLSPGLEFKINHLRSNLRRVRIQNLEGTSGDRHSVKLHSSQGVHSSQRIYYAQSSRIDYFFHSEQ